MRNNRVQSLDLLQDLVVGGLPAISDQPVTVAPLLENPERFPWAIRVCETGILQFVTVQIDCSD